MKNTKRSLTAVVVTAIALFASVNISASQPSAEQTRAKLMEMVNTLRAGGPVTPEMQQIIDAGKAAGIYGNSPEAQARRQQQLADAQAKRQQELASANVPAPKQSALALAKAKWAADQKRFAEQDAAKAAEEASKKEFLFEAGKRMQSRYDNK